MKIKIQEEIDDHTLVSHIVLECLKNSAVHAICQDEEFKQTGNINIDVKVNGYEADLMKLVNHWESQINSIVELRAKEIVREKYDKMITNNFIEIEELLEDLKSRVNDEIDKRLEDWEKK